MDALFLKLLDDSMARMGCFYVRYKDDWKLRAAIRAVNEEMQKLRVV